MLKRIFGCDAADATTQNNCEQETLQHYICVQIEAVAPPHFHLLSSIIFLFAVKAQQHRTINSNNGWGNTPHTFPYYQFI